MRIDIVSAINAGKYTLQLRFNDGTIQVIDFAPFLMLAKHLDIRAYLDENRFDDFHLDHGELVWGDYDLCFPIIDLYTNQIEKRIGLETAA